MEIKLSNENVTSGILPNKIHDLGADDYSIIENELGAALRTIEYIYNTAGVKRSLAPSSNPKKSINKTFYCDQIKKGSTE